MANSVLQSTAYRWLDGPTCSQEDWDHVDEILAARSWMALNRATSRIVIAEDLKGLAGFLPVQLLPHVEPLWVREDVRGTGVADTLADKAIEFLTEIGARGWMSIAEHPSAAKMCEARGWTKVKAPVYIVVRD